MAIYNMKCFLTALYFIYSGGHSWRWNSTGISISLLELTWSERCQQREPRFQFKTAGLHCCCFSSCWRTIPLVCHFCWPPRQQSYEVQPLHQQGIPLENQGFHHPLPLYSFMPQTTNNFQSLKNRGKKKKRKKEKLCKHSLSSSMKIHIFKFVFSIFQFTKYIIYTIL